MVNYRELYPNATKSEYLYKKEPKIEKLVRCIKLKNYENKANFETELEKKMEVEGKM